ncbi:MAG TPA: hypothetical protein VM843_03805 [Flavisolibacter sp.]|jgi:hypothetical protein|nr:hypothetical protein [Flavisolibacter sp.]
MLINEVGSSTFEHHEVTYKIDYFFSDKEVWGQALSKGHLWLVVLITSEGRIVDRFKFDEPATILDQPNEVVNVVAVRESKAFLDRIL